MTDLHQWIVLGLAHAGTIAGVVTWIVRQAVREALQQKRIDDLEAQIEKGNEAFKEVRAGISRIDACMARIDQRLEHLEAAAKTTN